MGTAIVLTRQRYVGTYLVENLSASGALLLGDTNVAIGERVRVLLQAGARPVGLSATVTRHECADERSAFAVRFVNASPATQDALQSIVLRQLHHSAAGPGMVVVVDRHEGDLGALVLDLLQIGRQAMRVETALTAIACLQASGAPVEAVIVDLAWVDGLQGLTLLEFFAIDYPSVRRVIACGSDLADADAAVEDGQVHAVLEKPWDRDSLLRALGDQT